MNKTDKKHQTKPDETGITRVEGFLRISDPETGKTIRETRA